MFCYHAARARQGQGKGWQGGGGGPPVSSAPRPTASQQSSPHTQRGSRVTRPTPRHTAAHTATMCKTRTHKDGRSRLFKLDFAEEHLGGSTGHIAAVYTQQNATTSRAARRRGESETKEHSTPVKDRQSTREKGGRQHVHSREMIVSPRGDNTKNCDTAEVDAICGRAALGRSRRTPTPGPREERGAGRSRGSSAQIGRAPPVSLLRVP